MSTFNEVLVSGGHERSRENVWTRENGSDHDVLSVCISLAAANEYWILLTGRTGG